MTQHNREGFSLVELIIAMLVLTVGVLALATTLGYLIVQIRTSDARTERALAVEQVEEQLRSTDFDALDSVAKADAESIGGFDVWWTVSSVGRNMVKVTIYSEGPGFASGEGWTSAMADSSSTTLARIGP